MVDIKASRWAFLASYLKRWLVNSRYNACEHDTPPGSASFDYFFTFVSHTDSDIERTLERQRHATELVAYMLYLDPDGSCIQRTSQEPRGVGRGGGLASFCR